MKQASKIPFSERWQKRRLFVISLVCIVFVLTLDLLTVLSFDSFPEDMAALTESQEIYTVFEEWYSYIGYFFSVFFYLILLVIMCVFLLANTWNNLLLTVPALLIWCSSLKVLSVLGQVGKLLTASRPNTFSHVAEGLGQLALIPLLLCLVYYMRRCQKLFVPLVLADCFCASALLLCLAWSSDAVWIYVTDTLSDGTFLVCFVAFVAFGIWEQVKKNDRFRFFVPSLAISVGGMTALRLFVALLKNGFVMSRFQSYLSRVSFSLSYLRDSWLDGILLLTVALLIVFNYLRYYHTHMLQLQSVRLRNEASLEYAQSLQRYETSVRIFPTRST